MQPLLQTELPIPARSKIFITHKDKVGHKITYEKTYLPWQWALEQKLAKKLIRSGIPIINAIEEKDVLPGCFRTSNVISLSDVPINIEGLDTLHISGSAQPSQFGFQALKRRISGHITVVNLKQEDGGFIEPKRGQGAIAFSYLMSMPWWIQENRTADAIDQSENQRCEKLSKKNKIILYGIADDNNLRKEKHTLVDKITICAKRIFTELQLAHEEGFSYLRIPDKKFGNMEDEHVDLLINFAKALPPNEHVHFHCKRGQSRTTLFMTMYDMIRNADRVSATEIITRQGPHGLGGVDLAKLPDPSSWDYSFKKGWLEFLYNFHAYARENKPLGFATSWSEWAKTHHIQQPQIVSIDHYEGAKIVSALPNDTLLAAMQRNTFVLTTLNEDKVSVPNFRTTQDLQLMAAPHVNMTGLSNVKASGSGQYSQIALNLLLKKLKPHARNVTICDLRNDDHLFVDGMNISRFQTREDLLSPRTPEDITESVICLRDQILAQGGIKAQAIDTKYPKDTFEKRFSLRLKPHEVETPEQLVSKLGARYLLIGSKRFSDSLDGDIDRFLTYAQTMPEDTWLHFSCRTGKRKTTFFMALYDLIHNADKVSMEDIVRRQHFIGGVNLFDITPKDPSWPVDRASKQQQIRCLARFHEFAKDYIAAKTHGEDIPTWTSWSKDHMDFQPDVSHLLVDRAGQ